MEVEKTIVRS